MTINRPTIIARCGETADVNEILSETKEGILISVIAPDGVGKSTFLELIKENVEKNNGICVVERILSVDTPTDFFKRFFHNLENNIEKQKQIVRDFIKKTLMPIHVILNAATVIPNFPDFSSITQSLIDQQHMSKTLSNIESEFIKLLQAFSRKFTEHSLVICIDDIDSCKNKDDFISIINDMKKTLPPRTFIIIASSEDLINSEELIPLTNFDNEQVREYVSHNFDISDENVIGQIIEKSGGYPLALEWLWQNYKRGENIPFLLTRLEREGFVQQLQVNFLNRLTGEEREILKICAALDVIDNRTVNKISGFEDQVVIDILDNMSIKSAIFPINYFELRNKQIVDVYLMDGVFAKLIENVYGDDIDIHKKALNYYANVLFDNSYFGENSVIGSLLQQYEHISMIQGKTPNAEDFFNLLDFDLCKKLSLCNKIICYFILAQKKEMAVRFSDALQSLSQTELDPVRREFYLKIAKLNRLNAEGNEEGAIQEMSDISDWLSPLIQTNQMVDPRLQTFLTQMKSLASVLKEDEFSVETLVKALCTSKEEEEKALPIFRNKTYQTIMMLVSSEQAIGAQNYEMCIELGTQGLEMANTLGSDDSKEYSILAQTNFSTVELEQLKILSSHVLGTAYLIKTYALVQSSTYEKNQALDYIQKSMNYLDPTKSDPVRGQMYALAESMYEQIMKS